MRRMHHGSSPAIHLMFRPPNPRDTYTPPKYCPILPPSINTLLLSCLIPPKKRNVC
ncbi:hypothetical protein QFZ97_008685 [Paraburkholderia youngii]